MFPKNKKKSRIFGEKNWPKTDQLPKNWRTDQKLIWPKTYQLSLPLTLILRSGRKRKKRRLIYILRLFALNSLRAKANRAKIYISSPQIRSEFAQSESEKSENKRTNFSWAKAKRKRQSPESQGESEAKATIFENPRAKAMRKRKFRFAFASPSLWAKIASEFTSLCTGSRQVVH